ncbi:MAG: thioesterase [Pseudomonadota bacterium]
MSNAPQTGQTHVLHSTVEPARTARALACDGEALPDVFATPFMIADMERACAAILQPFLADGDVSVGACIDISHTAPTPIGQSVKATATFTEKNGALYWFDVVAEDEAGRIGAGRIARAIVARDALMSKAGARG